MLFRSFMFGMTATPVVVQQAARGLPLVSIGQINYDAVMGVGVLADSPIRTPKDLEGGRIGVRTNSLTASVWTRDLATAHRAARRLQVGYVWINSAGAHIPGAPFGGYRQSGLGREGGLGELLSYTQEKNVYVAL